MATYENFYADQTGGLAPRALTFCRMDIRHQQAASLAQPHAMVPFECLDAPDRIPSGASAGFVSMDQVFATGTWCLRGV